MRSPTILLLMALAGLLPGCLMSRDTKNEPLDPGLVATLQPGVTTAREVVERLGAPTEVVQLGHRSAYRYDFTTTKELGLLAVVLILTNKDTRADRLWVFFDEDEVLTHLGQTYAAERARYAMPWTAVLDPEPEADDEPDAEPDADAAQPEPEDG